jgi:hypothetical protein
VGQSILSHRRNAFESLAYLYAPSLSKGNRVNIPEPTDDWMLARQRKRTGDAAGAREEFSFLLKPRGPWNRIAGDRVVGSVKGGSCGVPVRLRRGP